MQSHFFSLWFGVLYVLYFLPAVRNQPKLSPFQFFFFTKNENSPILIMRMAIIRWSTLRNSKPIATIARSISSKEQTNFILYLNCVRKSFPPPSNCWFYFQQKAAEHLFLIVRRGSHFITTVSVRKRFPIFFLDSAHIRRKWFTYLV